MDMENKLVVCVQDVTAEVAESKIKTALNKNYMISDNDFTATENDGFQL